MSQDVASPPADSAISNRWPKDILAILVLLGLLLLVFQLHTLGKTLNVISPVAPFHSLDHLAEEIAKVRFAIFDLVVALLIPTSIRAILVLELWKGRLSKFWPSLSKVNDAPSFC